MKLGLPTILFLVFLVLKLCGVIAWSWVWVTAPLWIGALLWLAGLILVAVAAAAKLTALDRHQRVVNNPDGPTAKPAFWLRYVCPEHYANPL